MNAEHAGREAAAAFRRKHGLGTQPLGDLVALIEQTHEADVAVLDAEPDVHGMTMRDPARGVVVVAIARTQNPMRQRSTLAHELGHIVSDDFGPPKAGGWNDRTVAEVRADAFARHLLVPTEAVTTLLAEDADVTTADLSTLVQQYRASPAIVTIQLREARLIDADTADEWKTLTTPALAARYGWIDQYRALQRDSDTRRAPQQLLARATSGYLANALSVHALARLRGLPTETVTEELSSAGICPEPGVPAWTRRDELPALTDDDFSDLDALEDADPHREP